MRSRQQTIGWILVFFGVVGMAAGIAGAADRGSASIQLGAGKVSIDYGRPALKGRTVAQLLAQLPADRMWRAGADRVTILETTVPLEIAGKIVPAGKYSVYVHCGEDNVYSLVLNKDLGQPLKNIWSAAPPAVADQPYPHFNYSQEIADQEVLRVPMKRVVAEQPVELFTIELQPSGDGATLSMAWGTEHWSVDVKPAAAEGSHPEGSHRR
ncbi:MAG: hypothetical protein Kow00109_01800 [Acidobacteriota bacterium]